MKTQRQILVFGNSHALKALASILRLSPLLNVVMQNDTTSVFNNKPDVVLVDAVQITPEQFHALIEICSSIFSIDPDTYQLSVLASPHKAGAMTETARLIGILAFVLDQASGTNKHHKTGESHET